VSIACCNWVVTVIRWSRYRARSMARAVYPAIAVSTARSVTSTWYGVSQAQDQGAYHAGSPQKRDAHSRFQAGRAGAGTTVLFWPGSLGGAAGDNDHPALAGCTCTGSGVFQPRDLTAEVRGMGAVRIRHPAQLPPVQQSQPYVRGFEAAGDQVPYSPAHIGRRPGHRRLVPLRDRPSTAARQTRGRPPPGEGPRMKDRGYRLRSIRITSTIITMTTTVPIPIYIDYSFPGSARCR